MRSLSPAYEELDLELRAQLDQVIRAFERAFLDDPTTRLEVFLASARDRREHAVLLLELLHVELEWRRELGQVPMIEEYLLRLPDDTDTVQAAFRASADNLSGTRLGQYQLVQIIGRGGMGVVYAAIDTVVNRQVAVKILSESLAADARAPEYLLREAQLVGQLLHPNIVTLFEAREVDGVSFLALEHVSGGSAASVLRHNGPFDWGIASRILLDVCHGLAAAHAIGLIHRDIKPANILLLEPANESPASSRSKLPLAKLTDFGLARGSEDAMCVGTPQYMAPEQFTHGTSNPTTDIYSLGATYFALLTGSPPFEAGTLAGLQEAHRTGPIPDVRKANPAIPEACGRIIHRCLAKSPEERYPTVELLIADLESLLAAPEKPRPARRRSLILPLTGAAALALVSGIMAIRTRTPTPSSANPPPASTKVQPPDAPMTPVFTKAGPWEPLLNGRDFTGWETRDKHGEKVPDKDGVFAVKAIDEEPAVWTYGQGDPFYLATLQEYENYHLSLEFCWLSPLITSYNGGVLYHCLIGEQDFGGHEFDLRPPGSGRYFPNRHTTRVDVGFLHRGQIIPGTVVLTADTPLNRKWDNELGKWNQIDIICVGDSTLHVLNSRVVLALMRSRFVDGTKEKPLTRGRIMLQSYRGTIAYRRIKIRTIDGIPPEFLSANGD